MLTIQMRPQIYNQRVLGILNYTAHKSGVLTRVAALPAHRQPDTSVIAFFGTMSHIICQYINILLNRDL